MAALKLIEFYSKLDFVDESMSVIDEPNSPISFEYLKGFNLWEFLR